MDIFLHNTLTGKKEIFKPIREGEVGIYSCGPTVYWNQHIGHMYAYVQWDCLVRSLNYLGYKTKWVMNLTDVGHLTSDEDLGEDKMEKGAKREGVSVWEIADKYIAQFRESLELLNVQTPDVLCRATEHIPEQIELIKKIEKNGFTYSTKTGIVFDTEKFPAYADFAHLHLEDQNAGSRVTVDEEKKKPWDFLLWITNQPNHIMKWESPWGVGFPGWHIECTAMSTKYLGETFDIHTGGKEHIPVHHTNEIAQAFGAFGHGTANFWLHNEWMLLDGQKISKSLGNSILVSDLVARGFDPLSLRYLIMTTHYKTGLNFTWESLQGAQTAYFKLRDFVSGLKDEVSRTPLDMRSQMSKGILDTYKQKFSECLTDDLNIAKGIGLLWKMINEVSKMPLDMRSQMSKGILDTILNFDKVLGLKLAEEQNSATSAIEIPQEVSDLVSDRDTARTEKNWKLSDELRQKIESLGFEVSDTPDGTKIQKK
jgi:cysteinyl-tRNA synthetase